MVSQAVSLGWCVRSLDAPKNFRFPLFGDRRLWQNKHIRHRSAHSHLWQSGDR